MFTLLLAAATLSCTAIDGDTLDCKGERVRLAGMDAPEVRCRKRPCLKGDPHAATANLKRLIAGKRLTLERTGRDPYGRTIAFVSVNGVDLSCAQIAAGQAVRVARWDRQRRLTRCRAR